MTIQRDFNAGTFLPLEITSVSFPVRECDFKIPVANWQIFTWAKDCGLKLRARFSGNAVVEVLGASPVRVLAQVDVTADSKVRDDWLVELVRDITELSVGFLVVKDYLTLLFFKNFFTSRSKSEM